MPGTYITNLVKTSIEASRLPSAPTLSWCDQAAEILRHAAADGPVIVAIGDVVGGMVQTVHASGAGGLLPEATSNGRGAGQDAARGATPVLRGVLLPKELHQTPQGVVISAAQLGETLAERGARMQYRDGFAHGGTPGMVPWPLTLGNGSGLFVCAHPIAKGVPNRRLLAWVVLPACEAGRDAEEHARTLAQALRAVSSVVAESASKVVGVARPRIPWLSERESEVLHYLTKGESVQSISQLIFRSPHTVQDYVKNLHRKLNASSRGELIALALGQATDAQREAAAKTLVDAE